MNLHVLSDLHLNVAALEVPKIDADISVLAGDIARPNEAMGWAEMCIRDMLSPHPPSRPTRRQSPCAI